MVDHTDSLQNVIHKWRQKNFPNGNADDQLLGVVEEVGELAHARLKMKQGIRVNEDLIYKEMDAIGDIVIFLMGYRSYRNISLFHCIMEAWQEVKERDWVKNKETGNANNNTGL